MSEISQGLEVAKLIFAVGLEVYRAIQAGDRHRTVGEIFDGVKHDMNEISRLEAEYVSTRNSTRG